MRRDYIEEFLSPNSRFVFGIVLMILFLLIDSLPVRSISTFFFMIFVLLAGKKILWKNYLVLIAFITFFNLLSPWGQVLISLGPIDVTEGALKSGLLKGITFTGLMLISLASVKKGLQLPGKFGGMIAKVFFYFERIFEQKHKIKKHDLIGTLDEILIDAFNDIEVLYEDEYFLIVNKEAEELTVPGRGVNKQTCLLSRAANFYKEVYIVHRLDQPTSGLVILALTKEAQRSLSIMFQNRKVEKEYIAIVDGTIKDEKGVVDLPVRGDMDNRPVQIVDRESGKKALTQWEVLSRNENKTRVLLKPETGRTHQLRVHMNAIGFPIEGDRLYNDKCPDDMYGELKLHAGSLSFIHPFTGEQIHIIKEPWF